MIGTARRPERIEWIALILIFLLALGLRLVDLDSMEFSRDAAFNLMKARGLARLERIPLTSATSSTDIPEPPIFMYLLALPIALSDDAVFVTGWIALLNALAVFPLFFLVRRHIAPAAAWMACSLFAVNPWQILYSRKIWTQDVLPFFALLFLLLLFESVFGSRKKLIVAAIGLLALTVQLHLSAIFVLPFTILFLLWQRKDIRWREVGIGSALAVVLFLPYLIFLGTNSDEIFLVLQGISGQSFVPRATGLLYPLKLVTTDGLDHVTLLFTSFDRFSRTVIDLTPVDYLARILLILGLLLGFLTRSSPARALGLYSLTSIGYVIVTNSQIFPHYYNALMPVLFIQLSLPLTALFVTGRRGLVVLSAALFATTWIAQLYFSASLLMFLSQQDCIWGEYGAPYRAQVLAVSETMEALSQEGEPIELETVHERASYCVDWDILATKYIYERLQLQEENLTR